MHARAKHRRRAQRRGQTALKWIRRTEHMVDLVGGLDDFGILDAHVINAVTWARSAWRAALAAELAR